MTNTMTNVTDPVTEYKIPQLETYVAPEGRDQILWLEPGGIRHLFNHGRHAGKIDAFLTVDSPEVERIVTGGALFIDRAARID